MRIVGGKNKGHRFSPPRRTPARPTTDIAKEGLFNIINNNFYFDKLKYLDLFGGTGSLSYEMASRGCPDITLVERDKGNINFINGMVKELDFPIQVIRGDVFKFIQNCQQNYKLIFAGPPYGMAGLDSLPDLIFKFGLLQEVGWFILEHNPNHKFDDHPHFSDKRNYGSTIFSIFECTPDKAEEA